MHVEKRNIGVCILLSIVTCGIYFLYWFYKISDDIYRLNGEESKAATDLVLSIITCGIYLVYCLYNYGKKLANIRQTYGLPYKDESTMFLIMGLLNYVLGVTTYIAICIIQSNLNDEFSNLEIKSENNFSN